MASAVAKLPAPLESSGLKVLEMAPLVALKAARWRRPGAGAAATGDGGGGGQEQRQRRERARAQDHRVVPPLSCCLARQPCSACGGSLLSRAGRRQSLAQRSQTLGRNGDVAGATGADPDIGLVAAVVVGAAGGQQAAALGQGGQGAAQLSVVLGMPDLDAVDAGLQGLGQDPVALAGG